MRKCIPGLTALAGFLLVTAGETAAAEALEPSHKFENHYWGKSDCDNPPKGPAVHLKLSNINSDEGNIRLVLYRNDDTFLKSGARIARVDFPAKEGDMDICLPIMAPGSYSLAVLHDANADGKYNVFREGYGFPNNPHLLFGPPGHDAASFTVDDSMVELPITVQYFYPSSGGRGPRH